MNWQRLFDEEIIERGRRYYHAKRVKDYCENDGFITATVTGTRNYEVFIKLNRRGDVRDVDCDCPYAESGLGCKHEVAVLFEYDKQHEKEKTLCDNEEVDVDLVKKEIGYLRKHYLGRYGYIEYWQVRRYVTEVLGFLDRDVHILIRQNKLQDAFRLANFILEKICNTPMDDDGEIMEAVAEASLVWQEIFNIADVEVRKVMFDWLMKQLVKSKHEMIVQVAEEFVMAVFDNQEELQKKKDYCDKMICKYRNGEIEYGGFRWVFYKAKILEQEGCADEAIRDYYKEWAEDGDVMIVYADWLMKKKQYDEAQNLLEKMIENEENEWYKYREYGKRLDGVYKAKGDNGARKQLLREILKWHIGEDEDLYNELRGLYTDEEWIMVRGDIIRSLSRHYNKTYYYAKEGMVDELMKELKKHKSLQELWDYAEMVTEKFPNEVIDIYVQAINEAVDRARNRMEYRDLMKYLRKMSGLPGGHEKALRIAECWKITFKNKRAMMDELDKVYDTLCY